MSQTSHITLSGAPEGFDARLVLDELARADGAPVLFVARDEQRMVAMQAALSFFAPLTRVITFPGWDCLPFDRMSPNAGTSAARMATLAGLATGAVSGSFVVLTTLSAVTQRLPLRHPRLGQTLGLVSTLRH